MRRVLVAVLRTDPALNQFCLDFFPEVHGEFTLGMLRSAKFDVLLSRVGTEVIRARLREAHANAMADHEHLIQLGDGCDPLPTSLLDAGERRIRRRMIEKVRKFWIEGVLEKSLHGTVMIELGKEYRPDAVAYPWDMMLERPDREPLPIPSDKKMIELFDENHGELLILGEPGSGKTTMLLDLCRDLLNRAEADETAPIPVVFNLSSWSEKHRSLSEWLILELYLRYGLAKKIGQAWITSGHIYPLLDGLDESHSNVRDNCVLMINMSRSTIPFDGLVICSRANEYKSLINKVNVATAIELQKLAGSQIAGVLSKYLISPHSDKVQESLHGLRALLSTPLFLILAVAALRNIENTTASWKAPVSERELMADYVRYRLNRVLRTKSGRSKPGELIVYISRVARYLQLINQVQFQIDTIQKDILSTKSGICVYFLLVWSAHAVLFCIMSIGQKESFASFGIFGLLWGLISSAREIRLSNRLQFSWKRFVTIGLLLWSPFGLGLINYCSGSATKNFGQTSVPFLVAVVFLLALGAISSVILLPASFAPSMLSKLQSPGEALKYTVNRTIRTTAAYTALLGLAYLLAFWSGHTDPHSRIKREFTEGGNDLLVYFIFAYFMTVLLQGGGGLIKHGLIRLVCWSEGQLPLTLKSFLDDCTSHAFFQRVGASYIFIHRLLMEYFASLTDEDIKRFGAELESSKKDTAPQSAK